MCHSSWVRYHTASSEYDASYNHTMQLCAIPVDLNDRCIMVDEMGDRDHNSMRPLKWKCTNVFRLLTNKILLGTKVLFQRCIHVEDV